MRSDEERRSERHRRWHMLICALFAVIGTPAILVTGPDLGLVAYAIIAVLFALAAIVMLREGVGD